MPYGSHDEMALVLSGSKMTYLLHVLVSSEVDHQKVSKISSILTSECIYNSGGCVLSPVFDQLFHVTWQPSVEFYKPKGYCYSPCPHTFALTPFPFVKCWVP